MSRKNPYPGAKIVTDARGGKRIRLRKTVRGRKIDCYLPGPWGSPAMIEAYNAAITEKPALPKSTSPSGTFGYVITEYLKSQHFTKELRKTSQYPKRLRLDWIRGKIGKARLADLEPHHVERMMDMKGGPYAANRLHQEIGELYDFARRKHGLNVSSPTESVKKRETKGNGFHTWTDEEVQQFRDYFESGTKARLAIELVIATGAARQDAASMGWQNIKGVNVWYRRIKTGQDVLLPLEYMPELQEELRRIPPNQKHALFITHGKGLPYTKESFGNWFRDLCKEAELPSECSLHGLRKYGATRLALHGATEWEVMAFLAHKDPREARRYVKEANRVKLARNAMARLGNVQQSDALDSAPTQPIERKR